MFSHARLNQPLIGSRDDAHESELGSADDAVFKSLAELRQANPEFPLADYALSVRRHIRLGSIVQRIVTDEGTDPAGGGVPINAGIRRPRSWAALPPKAPLLPGALLPGTGMLVEDDGGMEPRFVFDNGYGNKALHLNLHSVHIVSPPLRDNWPYFQQVARRHALSGCGVDPENPESMRDIYYRGCSSVRGHFGRRRSRRRCKLPWFCCFGRPCERICYA